MSHAPYRRLATALALVLASLPVCADGPEGLGVTLEIERGILAKLQTAYLFNMARFVAWPHPEAPVRLCLAADSPLARYAREIDGRELGDGRTLVVVLGDIDPHACSLAFVHGSTTPAAIRGGSTSMLTVGDAPDALQHGYAMQFFLQADTVHFAVNNDLIAHADYRISSKLLRLARPAP